jgi:hypothetical protein
MLADTSISPGHFKVWLDESMFRLGSSPAGVITADLAPTSYPLASAANIIAALINAIGISMHSPDYSALESANNSPLGINITDEMTVEDAINLVCGSVGAWYGFDNLNRFRVKILSFPGTTYLASIDEFEILSIEQEQIGANSVNSPVWRYAMNCVKNWTIQTTDTLAGSVSDADRAFYAQEWRTEERSDSSVKTAHLSAQDITADGYFISATDANTEALRRLTILKYRSVLIKVVVIINPANAASFEVGSDIKITYKRFGLQSGKVLKIISSEADYRKGQIQLGLWGPA